MNVVLQPCGDGDARKHYEDTIERPVKLSGISEFLGEVGLELERLFPEGAVPIWGVTPGKRGQNASKYKKLQKGDKVLFARKNTLFASATLVEKFHSKELAQKLWGTDKEGQTWEYIYFLDEVRGESISYRALNRAVGYSEDNIVRGFNVLDEKRSERAIAAFELASDRYFPPVLKETFNEAVAAIFTQPGGLDTKVWVNARKEQSYLRAMVLREESFASQCALCGHEYPVDLLVAAHIKKRSACTLEERKDARNIVMPVCKLGCDELYEKGYVIVDEKGLIRPTNKEVTSALALFLKALVGKRCLAFNSESAKYFEWQRGCFT